MLRAFLHNFLRDPDRPYDINKLTDVTAGESQMSWYRAIDRDLGQHQTEGVPCAAPAESSGDSEKSPDTVLVKTHNALVEEDGHPLVNLEVTAGAIYIVRNPLDVAISFSHHNGCSIDEIIDFMSAKSAQTVGTDVNAYEHYGPWSEHVMSWTASPGRPCM